MAITSTSLSTDTQALPRSPLTTTKPVVTAKAMKYAQFRLMAPYEMVETTTPMPVICSWMYGSRNTVARTATRAPSQGRPKRCATMSVIPTSPCRRAYAQSIGPTTYPTA